MRPSPLPSALTVSLCVFIAGCTAVEVVPPVEPEDEYVFACDKSQGQAGCETLADQVCPSGYETLSSEEDFKRKEMRVRCSGIADDLQ